MRRAISSWMAKMPLISRSKRWLQIWKPFSASISWAVMRSWLPALRTLPSSSVLHAAGGAPIRGCRPGLPLAERSDAREETRSPGTRLRALRISSAMPSQK